MFDYDAVKKTDKEIYDHAFSKIKSSIFKNLFPKIELFESTLREFKQLLERNNFSEASLRSLLRSSLSNHSSENITLLCKNPFNALSSSTGLSNFWEKAFIKAYFYDLNEYQIRSAIEALQTSSNKGDHTFRKLISKLNAIDSKNKSENSRNQSMSII